MAWEHVKSAEVLPTSIDKLKSKKKSTQSTSRAKSCRCRSRRTEQVLKSALRLPTSALAADEAEGGRRRASVRWLPLDCDGETGGKGPPGCCDTRMWSDKCLIMKLNYHYN